MLEGIGVWDITGWHIRSESQGCEVLTPSMSDHLIGTTYCLPWPSLGESEQEMIQFRGRREQWSGSHPVWPVHLSPEKKTQLKTFLHAWQSEKWLWNNQTHLTYLTVQYAWSIDCGGTRARPRFDSWGLALLTHHLSDCNKEILIAKKKFQWIFFNDISIFWYSSLNLHSIFSWLHLHAVFKLSLRCHQGVFN